MQLKSTIPADHYQYSVGSYLENNAATIYAICRTQQQQPFYGP